MGRRDGRAGDWERLSGDVQRARDALGYAEPRAFPPLAYSAFPLASSALVPSRRAAAATACLPQPLVRYRSHPRGRMGWWTSEQHRKPLAGRSLTALLQALRARLHAFSVTLPFQTPSDSCVSHVAAVHTPSDSAWG
jgi:hypothetical protein